MLVCACGEPVPLSRLRSYNPRDRANREQSFAAAQRHRAAAEPEAIAKQLAETLASREEQDRLAKRLAHLEAILKRMPEPKAKKRRRNRRPA